MLYIFFGGGTRASALELSVAGSFNGALKILILELRGGGGGVQVPAVLELRGLSASEGLSSSEQGIVIRMATCSLQEQWQPQFQEKGRIDIQYTKICKP